MVSKESKRGLWMLATVVLDAYRCTVANFPPHYKEFNDIDSLIDNLIHLQNMLYKPNYILVEFQGTIYNATGYGTQAQRRDIIALFNALHEYKNQQDKANTVTK